MRGVYQHTGSRMNLSVYSKTISSRELSRSTNIHITSVIQETVRSTAMKPGQVMKLMLNISMCRVTECMYVATGLLYVSMDGTKGL